VTCTRAGAELGVSEVGVSVVDDPEEELVEVCPVPVVVDPPAAAPVPGAAVDAPGEEVLGPAGVEAPRGPFRLCDCVRCEVR
jgi:hypothetical protein